MNKEEIIKLFTGNGYLISPDFVKNIDESKDYNSFVNKLSNLKNKPTIINNDLFLLLNEKAENINLENKNEERSQDQEGREGYLAFGAVFFGKNQEKNADNRPEPEGQHRGGKNSGYTQKPTQAHRELGVAETHPRASRQKPY